jgi:GTP-binding protein SAR1
MFIVNWAYKAASYLGLWSKDAKILFLGLDNAGKTTMLHMLKEGKLSSHQPTFHPNSSELQIGALRIQAHDLGGHKSARRLWNDYMTGVDAIVYMVDAFDRERFKEAKQELEGLLSDESLAGVPIAVFGNKIDLPHAASEEELKYALALETSGKHGGETHGQRPLEIFCCSVVKKFGYGKGLEWLSSYIK